MWWDILDLISVLENSDLELVEFEVTVNPWHMEQSSWLKFSIHELGVGNIHSRNVNPQWFVIAEVELVLSGWNWKKIVVA